jgi:putative intracellular protease/amidase
MVELGAFAPRTESGLALKSRRVVPGRLLQSGFTFSVCRGALVLGAAGLLQGVRATTP